MKRSAFFLLSLFAAMASFSQQFPHDWRGHWTGELLWYTGAEPKKVNMELQIQPADSGRWSWQLVYGSPSQDSRPYTLIAKDSAKGHWVIDEHNGIVLDQYLLAGRLSGAFTVQNSTIVNTYWLEGDRLHIEFYNISAAPVATTGHGTAESPAVKSYQVKSYQKAVLLRKK